MSYGTNINETKLSIILGIGFAIFFSVTAVISTVTRVAGDFFDSRIKDATNIFPVISEYIPANLGDELSHLLTILTLTLGTITVVTLYPFANRLPGLQNNSSQDSIAIRLFFIISYWATWSIIQLAYLALAAPDLGDFIILSIVLFFGGIILIAALVLGEFIIKICLSKVNV